MIKIHNINDMKKGLSNGTKAKILAFITIFIWATSYMATKVALQYFDSITLVVIRYFITAIALIIYIIVKKMRLPDIQDMPYFIISGLSGFTLYMIFFNRGVSLVSTGTASVIIASAPIITGVLSSILLNEKLSIINWIFVGISFSGILVLTLWEGIFTFNVGIFYLMVPAVLMAFYNILQRKFVKKYTVSESTSYSMLAGSLILILYSPKSIGQLANVSAGVFLLILYLALVVGVLGYILWSEAFTLADSVSDVVNFMFLTPFLVTIMGIMFLDEKLTRPTIIGGSLILLGLIGYNKLKDIKFRRWL